MTSTSIDPASSVQTNHPSESDSRPAKRAKMDGDDQHKAYEDSIRVKDYRETARKGVAPIKAEYLLHPEEPARAPKGGDDDDAEKKTFMSSGMKASYGTPRHAEPHEHDSNGKHIGDSQPQSEDRSNRSDRRDNPRGGRGGRGGRKDRGKKESGQNKNRQYGRWGDKIQLCPSRQMLPEFSPRECQFGDKCKFEHDLRKYLREGKSEDLTTLDGVCPVWKERDFCPVGWKCRFVGSHSKEIDREDGRKELVLLQDSEPPTEEDDGADGEPAKKTIYNLVPMKVKIDLERRRVQTVKADKYTQWLNEAWNPQQVRRYNSVKDVEFKQPAHESEVNEQQPDKIAEEEKTSVEQTAKAENDKPVENDASEAIPDDAKAKNDISQEKEVEGEPMEVDDKKTVEQDSKQDHRASYKEPPFLPSEKRRLYYGPDTPVLAPLTTQGNLPFRRLCVDLGAQVTWSEMAMGLPLVQGHKSEWALVKTHKSEIAPPTIKNKNIVVDYDNKKDLKFGVQIAANKPWIALKTTEVLATYCSHLRAIDLNCGCPIDLVFDSGAGSALLNSAPKLEKILRGMNAVSNEVPITCKIRTGVKDSSPNAGSIAERLVMGGQTAREEGLGPCGIAALTLHGRSRQQRYTKLANWEYIADVSALIKNLSIKQDEFADTVREVDPRHQPNGGKVYFCGNGDVLSHVDYNEHIEKAGVDSVMIGRGALIKPWVFEEIESNQYLDKSATERLAYIEKFCKYGMDTWGSDEQGVGTTRRFLLEWLSFACRYVPLGLLEVLPPKMNERPPPFKGRNELETLMASDDYQDWIKISEMFLGPANEGFKFTPKHKSNSYDTLDAEG